MKKKHKAIRLASLLLVFVTVTTALMSGTLAKYTSTATGNDIATVAKWEVELNGTDVEELAAAPFDLFTTVLDSDSNSETDVVEELIAPGTKGAFALTMENKSEVNANGIITFELTKPDGVNIDFTTGADYGLPEGYMPVEYIESTGTQHIDTDVTPDNNTRVVMDFAIVGETTGQSFMFGARPNSSVKNAFGLCINPKDGEQQFRADFCGETTSQKYLGKAVPGRYQVDFGKGTVTLTKDGTTYGSWDSGNPTITLSGLTLNLFGLEVEAGTTVKSSMKLYSCEIYDGTTLLRDFVPCVDDTGVAGLYDTVTKTFYKNAGSGTFKTGDVLGLADTDTADQYTISVPLAMNATKNLTFDWMWAYEDGTEATDSSDTAAGIAARGEGGLKTTVNITAVFEQVD